ncbi:MAG: helix-turn-helix transcriptional regulator [Sphingomonas sp.]|nr:MAG: helix-turn-helix transcriptional regulator [Sphingomonas sp.]
MPGPARLQPPRRQSFLIERPHLSAEMQTAPGLITLLMGPPGCGKTSALGHHFNATAATGRRAVWLSLCLADNEPAHMRASLHSAFGHGSVSDPADIRPPDNMDLYIDGLEAIHMPDALSMVEDFMVDLPANSRCYASAHSLRGGTLHYARLRGLVHIVPHNLFRMSDSEAAQILGDGWLPWGVQKLNQICDGWAAGLRFMALDPVAARQLLNDDRGLAPVPAEVAGYFDDVVCSTLSSGELAALMDASVLQRFTAATLASLPDSSCSWRLIEDHVRSGIFVSYLDDSRRWVGFNPAFGRHLRHRLRCVDPGRFDQLQTFAASWFQRNGFASEAIRHATQLTDPALSARIMEDAGALLAELGQGPFVNCDTPVHIDRAPDLPLTFLSQIYLLVRTGRIVEARLSLELLRDRTGNFAALDQEAGQQGTAFARIIEIVIDITEDRAVDEQRIATLEDLLAQHVGTNPVTAASIASLLAMTYVELCRFTEATTVCEIGLNALRELGSTKVAIFLRIQQAAIALACETISKAALYLEDSNRLIQAEGDFGRYEVLATQVLRAELHYEANELAEARNLLTQSMDELQTIGGWLSVRASAFTVAAAIAGIEQDFDRAEQLLRQGDQFARRLNLPRLQQFLLVARMREHARAHRWREASDLLEQADYQELIAPNQGSALHLRLQLPALLEAARLMIELGRPADATGFLDQVNKAFLNECDLRHRFTFRVLTMRASYGLRRYNAAVSHMLEALDLAMRAGLLQRALSNGPALVEVFDWSVRNGRKHNAQISRFVNDVLRGTDASESGSQILNRRPRHGLAPVTPNFTLSPRETEIMVLVAEGYMTKEIASRLSISEGTVKTHRKKIHEKLGVMSKSQAIARARELLII